MSEVSSKKKLGLTTQILIALIMGLVFGLILNFTFSFGNEGLNNFINTYIVNGLFHLIGKMFISSIKMLVVPLVLISLICGVTGIGDIRKLGRVGGKTLAFYLVTTCAAITLALLVANVINPGMGLDLTSKAAAFTAKNSPPLIDVIANIIPKNPFNSMVQGNMLQIIFFALLTGVATAALGNKADRVLAIFEQLNSIVMEMISLVMYAAPIGVFCLISKVFATQGMSVLLPLVKYMLTILIVLLLHLVFVYTMALKVFTRLSIKNFFKKFYPTMLVAFSTASSNATIPVTMKTLVERLGVSRGMASFSVPLGATVNMDGTAIMQGVAVIFISQVYGVDLTLADFMTVILTATLATIGTAGVPGVGLITLSMVLTQVNLPVEGIALIIGVDRLLDMSRTAVNITGDAIVSIIVAKSEGEFRPRVYLNPNAGMVDKNLEHFQEHIKEGHKISVQFEEDEEENNA